MNTEPAFVFNPPAAPLPAAVDLLVPKPPLTPAERTEQREQMDLIVRNQIVTAEYYLVRMLRNGDYARCSSLNCLTAYDRDLFLLALPFTMDSLRLFDVFVAESKHAVARTQVPQLGNLNTLNVTMVDAFNVFAQPYAMLHVIGLTKGIFGDRVPLFDLILPLIPDATWRAMATIVIEFRLDINDTLYSRGYQFSVVCLRWGAHAITADQRLALEEQVRVLRRATRYYVTVDDERHSAELVTNVADYVRAPEWPLAYRQEIMQRLVVVRKQLCYKEITAIATSLVHSNPRLDTESAVQIIYRALPCYDDRVIVRGDVVGIIERVRASALASEDAAAARNVVAAP